MVTEKEHELFFKYGELLSYMSNLEITEFENKNRHLLRKLNRISVKMLGEMRAMLKIIKDSASKHRKLIKLKED